MEWFNQCFERCGIDATVSGFDAERLALGKLVSVFATPCNTNPQAKMHPVWLVNSRQMMRAEATGVALQNFLKEVRFYQQLQSRLSIRTPRCYYAEITGEGPEFSFVRGSGTGAAGRSIEGCDATPQKLLWHSGAYMAELV